MSMEQLVCNLVVRHWPELHPNSGVPDSLVFLKVAGKTSRNAAIISLVLDGHRRTPVAVAKIPRNPTMTRGLEREYDAMLDIRKSVKDPKILACIPYRGAMVEDNGIKILLQQAVCGHPMVRAMTSRKSFESLSDYILSWMLDFHADGAEECRLEGEPLRRLVELPIAEFMDRLGSISCKILSAEARKYLLELPRRVQGRMIRLCRQHGDFNAHNILIQYKDGCLRFGLIDWEDYRPCQLPVLDLNHFFTSNSKLLGARMSPVESYVKLVLNDGWYRNFFLKAIGDVEARGLIDQDTFWLLTPLYFVSVALTALDVQRLQEETLKTWLLRLTHFIKSTNQM